MEENKKSISKLVQPFLKPVYLFPLAGILVVICALIFIGNKFTTESKPTKLTLEDIGELATQSAYVTEVNLTEDARDIFGLEIPFTQSKTIFSYDVVIKAGINFADIQYSVNDTAKTISVTLPECKILSNEIQTDSFKLYHEAESIFTPITVEDVNSSISSLTEDAEQTALDNGILDEARTNAESILTGFFGQQYEPNEYEITFN